MDIAEFSTPVLIALSGQVLLLLAGLVVLARLFLTSAGRHWLRKPSPLTPLPWSWLESFIAAFVVIAGAVAGAVLGSIVVSAIPVGDEVNSMVMGTGFQFGMLVGAFFAKLAVENSRPPEAIDQPATPDPPAHSPRQDSIIHSPWVGGPLAMCAAFPVIWAVNYGWLALLQHWELNMEKQTMVEMFSASQSTHVLIGMCILAIVVAPVTEEIVFRAGLYRFLRTRIPRWAAVVLPALLFGAMHDSLVAKVPLVVLAVILALAYERTGRISVPIVAHALFNLNTILMLLAGVQF